MLLLEVLSPIGICHRVFYRGLHAIEIDVDELSPILVLEALDSFAEIYKMRFGLFHFIKLLPALIVYVLRHIQIILEHALLWDSPRRVESLGHIRFRVLHARPSKADISPSSLVIQTFFNYINHLLKGLQNRIMLKIKLLTELSMIGYFSKCLSRLFLIIGPVFSVAPNFSVNRMSNLK